MRKINRTEYKQPRYYIGKPPIARRARAELVLGVMGLAAAEYSPWLQFVGVEDGLSEEGVGSVSLAIKPHHLQGAGQVHGGLIAVLVDTAFFRAVSSILRPAQRTTTVELKVNYLESADSGRLTSTARIISNSNRLVVADVDVEAEDGRLIAQGLGTFLLFGGDDG